MTFSGGRESPNLRNHPVLLKSGWVRGRDKKIGLLNKKSLFFRPRDLFIDLKVQLPKVE